MKRRGRHGYLRRGYLREARLSSEGMFEWYQLRRERRFMVSRVDSTIFRGELVPLHQDRIKHIVFNNSNNNNNNNNNNNTIANNA